MANPGDTPEHTPTNSGNNSLGTSFIYVPNDENPKAEVNNPSSPTVGGQPSDFAKTLNNALYAVAEGTDALKQGVQTVGNAFNAAIATGAHVVELGQAYGVVPTAEAMEHLGNMLISGAKYVYRNMPSSASARKFVYNGITYHASTEQDIPESDFEITDDQTKKDALEIKKIIEEKKLQGNVILDIFHSIRRNENLIREKFHDGETLMHVIITKFIEKKELKNLDDFLSIYEEQGENKHYIQYDASLVDAKGRTPLNLITELMPKELSQNENILYAGILHKLYSRRKLDVNIKDDAGYTPLFWAIEKAHPQLIISLLTEPAQSDIGPIVIGENNQYLLNILLEKIGSDEIIFKDQDPFKNINHHNKEHEKILNLAAERQKIRKGMFFGQAVEVKKEYRILLKRFEADLVDKSRKDFYKNLKELITTDILIYDAQDPQLLFAAIQSNDIEKVKIILNIFLEKGITFDSEMIRIYKRKTENLEIKKALNDFYRNSKDISNGKEEENAPSMPNGISIVMGHDDIPRSPEENEKHNQEHMKKELEYSKKQIIELEKKLQVNQDKTANDAIVKEQEHQKSITEMQTKHKEQVNQLKADHGQKLTNILNTSAADKAQLEERLKNLNESHATKLEELKTEHANTLTQKDSEYTDSLKNIQTTHEANLLTAKKDAEAQKEKEHKQAVEAIEKNYQEQIGLLEAKYDELLKNNLNIAAADKAQLEEQLKSLNESHATKLEELKTEHANTLTQKDSEYTDNSKNLQIAHEAKLVEAKKIVEEQRQNHEKAIEVMQKNHQEQIGVLTVALESRNPDAAEILSLKTQIDTLRKEHTDFLAEANTKYLKELEELCTVHTNEIEKLNKKYNTELEAANNKAAQADEKDQENLDLKKQIGAQAAKIKELEEQKAELGIISYRRTMGEKISWGISGAALIMVVLAAVVSKIPYIGNMLSNILNVSAKKLQFAGGIIGAAALTVGVIAVGNGIRLNGKNHTDQIEQAKQSPAQNQGAAV